VHYRKHTPTGAILLLILCLGATVSVAEKENHFRWVNDAGETVYSDRPPPAGVDYEIVSSKSGTTRSVTASEGAGQLSAAEQAAVDEAELARQVAESCKKARANLAALAGDARIVVRTPDGEMKTLSPEEIELQRETARSQVEAYCK